MVEKDGKSERKKEEEKQLRSRSGRVSFVAEGAAVDALRNKQDGVTRLPVSG